jgi:hypothetical protein
MMHRIPPRALSVRRHVPVIPTDTETELDITNPFDLPPDSSLFDLRDREAAEMREQHNLLMQRSLVDRTLSRLPPLHASSGRSPGSPGETQTLAPPPAERQQRQQMTEFVDQKREIFLVQLLIDRKNKEIDRIQNIRKTEKKNIIQEQGKIAEQSNQNKMTTSQQELELSRAKRSMDAAIKQRTELSKELKKKTAFVQVLESEISRNQETLDAYRSYAEFMKRLTPESTKPLEFFTEPEVLLQELENVENENLFLIRHCQELTDEQDGALRIVQAEIDGRNAESEVLMAAVGRLPQVTEVPAVASGALKECDALDVQLRAFAAIVRKTYRQCFSEASEVNTLTRLERLEMELETMYRQSGTIDPSFRAMQQTEKDRARRDKQRKEKAEKLEREQKRKLEQALIRAQMPVKRRAGRPVYERTLPIKKRKDPIDERKKQQEEQQQEVFLYGPIPD